MMRFAAVAVLAWAVVQDESIDSLAQQARAAIVRGDPLEAADRIDAIRRREPLWEGRRPLVYEAAESRLFRGADLRARGLEMLRRLQADFPGVAEDGLFGQAALRVLGYGFLVYSGRAAPGPAVRLECSEAVDPEMAAGAPRRSTLVHYRLRDDAVRRAVDRMLAGPGEKGILHEVPREAWEVVGRPAYDGTSHPVYDLSRPGLHVIEEELEGLRARHRVTVSSFDVMVKRSGRSLLAWAWRPSDGEPVPGVLVRVQADGRELEGRTGDDGLARFEAERVRAVVASQGSDIHVDGLWIREEAQDPPSRIFITTDRPVYRPGQTVRFKAVGRDLAGGRLRRPRPGRVPVEIRDPEDRLVHQAEAEWNAEGSLSGEFRLGEEPPLGDYGILVGPPRRGTWDERPWGRTFTVAEYRKPEFRVSVEFPDGAPLLGQEVRARIRAEYHFGGPVAGADVAWSVSRNPVWDRERRRPGEDARLEFYRGGDLDGLDGSWTGEAWYEWSHPVTRGEGRTGPDGALDIRFAADRRDGGGAGPYAFTVEARVVDLTRFEASGQASIVADPSDLRVRVESPAGFARVGGRLEVRARATDRQGRPAEGRRIDLTAFIDPRGTAEFESFFSGSAPADADGWAFFAVTPERGGTLRLRASVQDDAGRRVEDRVDLPSAGAPDEAGRQEALSVLPERYVYEPGETARLLVRLPRRRMTALLTVEGDGVHDAKIVRFRDGAEILEIPLRDVHAPNVFVKVLAFKDDVCYAGGHEIAVLPSASWIDVEVKADRETWRPGEAGRVSVTTRLRGKPVAAEVELAVVDEPVFDMQPERAPDIRRFFLRPREDGSLLFSSGAVDDECRRLFHSEAAMGLTGATFTLEEAAAPPSVRRNFPDTLLWRGHVRTGEDGRADVDLTMADSLTTWRLTARAAAGDDRFGSAVSKTLCRKEVFVRLASPRVFTERDRGEVAAVVHNDRAEDLEFRVRMEADGLSVEGGEKRLRVPAGGSVRTSWSVRADKAGDARLRVFAESPGGSDAMERTVPVRPHGQERVVARTGLLKGRWEASFEVPAQAVPGTVRLDVSARPAGMAAVLDALPGLAGYPYGCVEQTMSRFLPSVVAADALRRLGASNPRLEAELPAMVDAGLRRLYDFQHEDGGWGWWKTDATHPFMTAYVAYGLGAAKAAGVPVRPDVLEKALDRLSALPRTAFAAHVLASAGRPVDLGNVEAETEEDRAWLVLAGRRDLAGGLRAEREEPPTGAEIRAAALVLRAVGRIDRRDPRVRSLTEWLMLQRRGDGWLSTLDTAHVVYALCEQAAAEAPTVFTLRINGEEAPFRDGRLSRPGPPPGKATVVIEGGGDAPAFGSAVLRYRTGEEGLAEEAGAFEVTRRIERRRIKDGVEVAEPVAAGGAVRAGELLWVVVHLRAKAAQEYVMLECPLPAGAEPVDGLNDAFGFGWGCDRRELRDDRACFALSSVDGAVEYAVPVRLLMPGELHVLPARAFAMYDPDRQGASSELLLRVEP